MSVSSDLESPQPSRPERQTRRLTPPDDAPTTLDALNAALLLERYAKPVKEWTGPHIDATPPITADLDGPVALRLVVDNTSALFETLGDLGEVA